MRESCRGGVACEGNHEYFYPRSLFFVFWWTPFAVVFVCEVGCLFSLNDAACYQSAITPQTVHKSSFIYIHRHYSAINLSIKYKFCLKVDLWLIFVLCWWTRKSVCGVSTARYLIIPTFRRKAQYGGIASPRLCVLKVRYNAKSSVLLLRQNKRRHNTPHGTTFRVGLIRLRAFSAYFRLAYNIT